MIKIILHPFNNWLSASEYTLEDQEDIYDQQLQDIIDNPRWYLDNLDKLYTYRVVWTNYSESKITLPFKYVRHQVHKKKAKVYK